MANSYLSEFWLAFTCKMKPQDTETVNRLQNKFENFTHCVKGYWGDQPAHGTVQDEELHRTERGEQDLIWA